MQLKTGTVITGLNHTPLLMEDGKTQFTVREVCVRALANDWSSKGDRPTGDDKFKRGKLAQRVWDEEVVELTAEDAALLKLLVGYGFTPVAIAFLYPLLDGGSPA